MSHCTTFAEAGRLVDAGRRAPFLLTLCEEDENELHITICCLRKQSSFFFFAAVSTAHTKSFRVTKSGRRITEIQWKEDLSA